MAEKVVNLSLVLLSKLDTSGQESATKTATSHIRQPPLMRNLNNPSVLRTPGLVLAHQRLGGNPLVVLAVFQTV